MRRRGVGVGAVTKKKDETKQFQAVGKQMEEMRMAGIQEVLSKFHASLADFAEKHRKRINSDPEFRQQFNNMCVSVGVDPLASNKGFWADVLGVGNFYFKLGIVIIQICLQTRSTNGGIISLKELLSRVRLHYQRQGKTKDEISADDIEKSIEKLSVLGGGYCVMKFPRRDTLVRTVPLELNRDFDELVNAAQDSGYVTGEMMAGLHNWSSDRFFIAIGPLLQEGIVWLDEYGGVKMYVFPSLWKLADVDNMT